ncbi:DUF1761 domain-containing protein [Kribbella sp. NPDC006257]|uniref:DUF1761 domain-containing protein n=1 Tax=Kribbella sp. NPDC006257 TaxID=3156738 RepID=UPI0033A7C120
MNVFLSIVVAAVAVFVVSSAWYVVFAAPRAAMLGTAPSADRPPVRNVVLELLRSALVASVIAGLAAHLAISSVAPALLLGLVLFAGFPFVLLTGSVLWDKVNWQLAAIHGGDWLLKLLVISLIIGLFR